MPSRVPSSSEYGVALVSVLWVLLLLTIMATTLTLNSRSLGLQTRNILEAAQTRHAAEGGIKLALASLSLPVTQRPWLADGSPYQIPLDDMQIWVALFDDSGKIDLNAAGPELLDGLLRVAEVEDGLRHQLVDAIQDWRDRDDLRRLNGAEDDDYIALGLDDGAKDGPFETVEELQRVLGMTRDIYRRIHHSLTVSSRRNSINPLYAPRQVLLALPDVDEAQIDQFIDARHQNFEAGLPPPDSEFLPPRFISGNGPSVNYTIHTEARLDTGGRSRMEAVVSWQRGSFTIGDIKPAILPFFTEQDR